MKRRRGSLSAEDSALWEHVTRDVAKLAPKPRAKPRPRGAPKKTIPDEPAGTAPSPSVVEATPAAPKAEKLKSAKSLPSKVKVQGPPPPPPLTPLDRVARRQVVRGTRAIDSRIDLHGLRQDEAHAALRGFLWTAQARGHRLVLVITGKGGGGVDGPGLFDTRGVLRRVVPQWLHMADMRAVVLGFEEAHRGHGGDGALYVRLRRPKNAGDGS